jgi:hypothetical protein
VSEREVIELLARWIRELRWENARLTWELEQRRRVPTWFTNYHAYWLDRYPTSELIELAGTLER